MQLELSVLIFVVVIVVGGVFALWVVYQKLSLGIDRLSKQSAHDAENVIAQVEALLTLHATLNLNRVLPPTRGWAASPDFLRNLVSHTLSARPRSVVECSSGISTVVLARCMEILGTGHVFSLEHDAQYAEKTRRLLLHHGLSDFATVCDAPLKEINLAAWSGLWYTHTVLPDDLTIDLLVVDGPPWFVAEAARYPAVPMLHDRFNTGAVVLLDDAARVGEKVAVKRWLDEFSDLSLFDVPACEKGCVAIKKADAPQ